MVVGQDILVDKSCCCCMNLVENLDWMLCDSVKRDMAVVVGMKALLMDKTSALHLVAMDIEDNLRNRRSEQLGILHFVVANMMDNLS